MPMVWLGRRQGKQVERFCGPDVMPAILDRSRRMGFSHFFYGGKPGSVELLAESLQERFPGLNVAGIYSPPFRPLTLEESAEVAKMINDSGADFVWVGLGSPKQDHWLASFRPLLKAPVLLAVGAAFDFHNGKIKRAPKWAQRSGVEWLFRLGSEPRRLFWRYTVTGLRFGQLLVRSPRAEASR
jgi:N-acetylglucosaminyldiphosphoundecaprenol N-acetyl-beta-D-mannosaminyltransferase